MTASVSLYIHIPFCRKRCSYCSFVSYAGRLGDIAKYMQAVKYEISQRIDGRQLKSVYFGGGTPSLVPARYIKSLMESIRRYFPNSGKTEVSLEANPCTIDNTCLKALLNAGINRLSIGLQSLDDGELSTLGRLHNSQQALEAVKHARSAGFDNINLDLIYGIPGQTVSSWEQTLREAVNLSPEHLSLYGLSLEPGTLMMELIESGALPQLNPDLSADQYELAEEILEEEGYRHYEISNWAKPGYECRHNLVYWNRGEYIGAGTGASSYLGGRRYNNTSSLDKYLEEALAGKTISIENDEIISPELASAEAAILSLRLDEGIDMEKYNRDYCTDILSVYNKQITELEGYGLIQNDGVYIKLTPRGRLLGNEVFWRFLPELTGETNLHRVATE